MSDFNIAVEFVLKHEGGLVDSPNDPGGLTNFGISQRSFPALDIRNITRDQAVGIYRAEYWMFDSVIDQRVANKLLDQAVNFGKTGGSKILAAALKGIGAPSVNGAVPEEIWKELAARGALSHCMDVIARPNQRADLLGWLRRDFDG